MQTDYIDLYQLHGGTIADPFEEIVEAFETLQGQGKIRYFGISSIRPNVIRRFVNHSNIVSVMMQYSLLDRRPEEECLALLQDHSIGVLARGAVAGGLLAGKLPKNYLDLTASQVQAAAQAVEDCTVAGRNAPQTAIQFVLRHPAITAAVVGIRNIKQLVDAVGSIVAPQLTAGQMERLKKSVPVNRYTDHRV